MKLTVISGTSVLIAFESLGMFPVLKKIFPHITIPEGVYIELNVFGGRPIFSAMKGY